MLGGGADERFAAAGGEGLSEAVVRNGLACQGHFSAHSDSEGTSFELILCVLVRGGLVVGAHGASQFLVCP